MQEQNAGLASKKRAQLRTQRFEEEATLLWAQYKQDPFFTFGLGIYWGEGTKVGKELTLTNSEPAMLKQWLNWCQRFIPFVNTHAEILIYDDINQKTAKLYWEKELGVPVRIYINKRSSSSKQKRKPSFYGTGRIKTGTGCTEAFVKVMHWLRMYQ